MFGTLVRFQSHVSSIYIHIAVQKSCIVCCTDQRNLTKLFSPTLFAHYRPNKLLYS